MEKNSVQAKLGKACDPAGHGSSAGSAEETGLLEIQLLAEALSHLGEGVVLTGDQLDWPGPKIIYVNSAMCRITGYSASELVGQSPRMLQGAGSDRDSLGRMRAELAAGRCCTIEVVNYRKDGTPYDAEIFASPVVDAAGHQTHFVAVHRDVSASKRAERALRESEQRVQAILDTAADAIITLDRDGTVTSANPASERMFGFSCDELLGLNANDLMPPLFGDEPREFLSRFRTSPQSRITGTGRELIAQRKDGSTFPVDLAISQIDHLERFVGIVRDISHCKNLQKQVLEVVVEEQQRIGQELHDGIGQELTSLSLFAGTLLELLEQKPQRPSGEMTSWTVPEAELVRIREIASRLSHGLVQVGRNVQQLSRGIIPVQIGAEGLTTALQELAAVTDAQQKISCCFDCPAPVAVENNPVATHLFRIAQEAVNNALKHGQAQQIMLSLQQVNDQIVLTISDDGIGWEPHADQPAGTDEPVGTDEPAGTSDAPGTSRRSQGCGVDIMHYRAGIIGGVLRIGRRDAGGTWVQCKVPRGGVEIE